MDQQTIKVFEEYTHEKVKTLMADLTAKADELKISGPDKAKMAIWTMLSVAADLANANGMALPDATKILGSFFEFHLKKSMEKHGIPVP